MFLAWTWYTCNASGIRFRFWKHSTYVHSTMWVVTEHVVYIQMSHYRNVYQHAISSQQAHEHEEHMFPPVCTWKWPLIGRDFSRSSLLHPGASHFTVHNFSISQQSPKQTGFSHLTIRGRKGKGLKRLFFVSFSSSLGATTSIVECFGLLSM